MSLFNSIDRQRENTAAIANAGGKAVTLRLLGGDSITGTVTPTEGGSAQITDSAGVTWHVSLHNVTAVGVAA